MKIELTESEVKLLDFIAEGLTCSEIALFYGVTWAAISQRRKRIREKIGLKKIKNGKPGYWDGLDLIDWLDKNGWTIGDNKLLEKLKIWRDFPGLPSD